MNVQAFCTKRIGRQDAVERRLFAIRNRAAGVDDLKLLREQGGGPHHACRFAEHDRSLFAIRSRAVDFRSVLAVHDEQIQADACKDSRLARLLGRRDIRHAVAAQVIGNTHPAEQLRDHFLLPIKQQEWLLGKLALAVPQPVLKELHRVRSTLRVEPVIKPLFFCRAFGQRLQSDLILRCH